jgi:hypothetical protein
VENKEGSKPCLYGSPGLFGLSQYKGGEAIFSGFNCTGENKTASASLSQETDAVILFGSRALPKRMTGEMG